MHYSRACCLVTFNWRCNLDVQSFMAAMICAKIVLRCSRPHACLQWLPCLTTNYTSAATQQRILTVALVGYPNAGKSELCNKLIGVKISGVSTKRNTTLEPRLGAFTSGDTQIVLYDTPGLVTKPEASNPLERLRSAWHVAAAADLVLYIVDADKQFKVRERALLDLAGQLSRGPRGDLSLPFPWPKPPLVLLLNKRDKLPKDLAPSVLKQLEVHFKAAAEVSHVFPVSALEGQGIGTLRQYLLHKAKPGRWLLPAGQCHVSTPGELAVELVREKLLRRLHKELPYRLGVVLMADRPWQTGRALAGQIQAIASQQRQLDGPALVSNGESHGTSHGTSQVCGESRSAAGGVAVEQQGQQGPGSDAQPEQLVNQVQKPQKGRFVHVEVLADNPRVKNIVIGPKGSIIQQYVALPTQHELSEIFKQEIRLSVSVRVVM